MVGAGGRPASLRSCPDPPSVATNITECSVSIQTRNNTWNAINKPSPEVHRKNSRPSIELSGTQRNRTHSPRPLSCWIGVKQDTIWLILQIRKKVTRRSRMHLLVLSFSLYSFPSPAVPLHRKNKGGFQARRENSASLSRTSVTCRMDQDSTRLLRRPQHCSRKGSRGRSVHKFGRLKDVCDRSSWALTPTHPWHNSGSFFWQRVSPEATLSTSHRLATGWVF